MPSAAFTTLGCKVNQYETQKILESFEAAGFAIVPFDQPADVFVINTCSVTSIAESKSRYTIRKASRTNPDAKVVVTGCAVQMSINREEEIDGAHLTVPNPEKFDTFAHFKNAFPELVARANSEPAEIEKPVGRTRATLKVQDGCSVMCSYCSIPYTRPGLVSRPAGQVLAEAETMLAMGYRELVLTGVLIGAYGPESGSGGPDFEALVSQLAQVTGDQARIRISSIEMRQVTPRLIELIQSGQVVPHLHIPLQSGDSGVLSDMNRPYSQADYLALVESLYREIPDFSLTTDIMVGFPTETTERFESTVHVCEEARYLKVHAFRFSPRFGTPADAFGDPISTPEKQARSLRLAEISKRTGDAHVAKFTGRTMRVLVEGKMTKDGLLEGLTDNYLTVVFAGPKSLQRQFCHVTIHEARDGIAYGELSSQLPLNRRAQLLPVQ
jgi:threonylcarbamoyladenosine tRNA methylthiotransferase MtaB